MHKKYNFLIAGLVFFFFSSLCFAQAEKNVRAVIISASQINAKNIDQINASFASTPGVEITYYCEFTNTAVLMVDNVLHPNDSEILTIMKTNFDDQSSVVLVQKTVDDIKDNCTYQYIMPPLVEE